jgi:hypothetical protein
MFTAPATVYVLIGTLHLVQQVMRSRALSAWQVPQTDFLVQALVMTGVVELLHQNHMAALAWLLTAPALVVTGIVVFYYVLAQCSM